MGLDPGNKTRHEKTHRTSKITNKTNLCGGEIHNFLCCQICLVANKQFVHVLAGISVDFLEPLLHVVERLLGYRQHAKQNFANQVCYVVHNDDTMRSTVVARCDGAESFLSSSVPLNNDENRILKK